MSIAAAGKYNNGHARWYDP